MGTEAWARGQGRSPGCGGGSGAWSSRWGDVALCLGRRGVGLREEPPLFHFVQMPTLTGSLGSGLLQGGIWQQWPGGRIWASFPAHAMVMGAGPGSDLRTLSVAAEQDPGGHLIQSLMAAQDTEPQRTASLQAPGPLIVPRASPYSKATPTPGSASPRMSKLVETPDVTSGNSLISK